MVVDYRVIDKYKASQQAIHIFKGKYQQRTNQANKVNDFLDAIDFLYCSKCLPLLTHLYDAYSSYRDFQEFNKKVDNISESIMPELASGHKLEHFDKQYQLFTIANFATGLGVVSSLVGIFDTEKIAKGFKMKARQIKIIVFGLILFDKLFGGTHTSLSAVYKIPKVEDISEADIVQPQDELLDFI